MGLSRYRVGAGLAVSDMDRAREFYEGKLGLSVGIDSSDNVQYRCAEGSVMHVYLSPEHADKSTATLVGWDVDDVEGVVDELAEKGVVFERYDEGPIITDEKGVATFESGAKVAYFKDPDGNTLSIAHRATFLCSVAPKEGSTERHERFAANCGRRGEPDHRRERATFASLTEGQVETSASRRCEAPEAATGRRASERRAMSTRNGTSRPVSPQRKLAREEVLTCRKRTAPGSIGRRRSTRSASSMRPDGPFPSGNSPTTSGVCANSAAPSRVGASSG